jgi:hypothetical protein
LAAPFGSIAVVKKTFRFGDAFFATTAYAAILFAERNYDKRHMSNIGNHRLNFSANVDRNLKGLRAGRVSGLKAD